MPDKKLTDNEIVKALECCCNAQCSKCKYYGTGNANCVKTNMINSLDLINRLQAEIEALKTNVINVKCTDEQLKAQEQEANLLNYIKAEAYKEFANELKCRTHEISYNTMQVVNEYDIDNLLKELVGDAEGERQHWKDAMMRTFLGSRRE